MKTAAGALPAMVGLLLAPDGQMGAGSGVIISADGWILTAGHVGVKPGVEVRVLLADGTELKGLTVGQHLDQDQDAGLVKADTQGRTLPFLPIGSTKNMEVGDPILVFGHPLGPELKPWRPPPLRVGHILALTGTVLVMDAPVTPGDSGGPVLDLDGRIVGITSVASHRPDVNAAVTADFVSSKLEALKQPQRTGTADPSGAAMVGLSDAFEPAARQAQRARHDQVNEVLAPLVFTATDSVVSVLVDARAAVLGVVVDDAGHILTKASEVGVGPRIVQVAMPDGQIVGAKRIAQDERLDLMLLATGVGDSDPIQFVDAELAFGAAVISVGQGMAPAAVGFRSLAEYDAGASDQASRSLIGVVLRPATTADRLPVPGVVVMEVMDGSGAKEAGLRVGDGLLVVDGVALTSPDAPGAVLRQHAPGDTVQVEFVRGGARKTVGVRLQRPPIDFGPGNVGAALSRRATGFGSVIQHDGVVPAEAMGAPIVDSQGQVVGLNIARADRTKTYALSSATVNQALKQLLQAAAEGQSAEPPDLRTVLKPVAIRGDGRAVLSAGQARLYGPTITLQGEDDFQVIQGWASPEDVAVWVLDVPAPGRYEFHLDALGVAGGNVDLFVAGELFTVRVKPAGDATDFQASRAGESFFEEAGPVLVRVQPLDRPRGPIMNLREVRVSRMDVVRLVERMVPILRFRDMERMQRDWDREAQKARARKANEQTEIPK
jgi:serine protease Do